MKKIQLFVLSCIFVCTTMAQTIVLPYTPGVTTEGVTYYLPKTQLCITLTTSSVTKYPGELYAYAERYLKLNDVTKEKNILWTLNKIDITTQGIPDTSKVYNIPLRKATIAPLVSLSKNGLILSINTESPEETPTLPTKVSKSESSKMNSKDYLSQEILYAGNKNKIAELAATEIYDIRDHRSELTKGEADNMPKDGEQLKLMIQQLGQQEEALLQLFKGYEEHHTETFTLNYLPQGNVKKEIFFRFSDVYGVLDKDNLAGEPVYIDVTDQKTVPAVQSDGKKKKIDEQAVRYNVASDVNIKIYTRQKTLAEITTPLPQFGRTEILSNELFNKRTSTKVLFNQSTGTLKKVSDDNPMK